MRHRRWSPIRLLFVVVPTQTRQLTAMMALPSGAGGAEASRMSAVATMSLSATGSRNAPKAVVISSCICK